MTAAQITEAQRRQHLDAMRHFDPQASLSEELTVRLSTPKMASGGLDFGVADLLLSPLEDTVTSLSMKDVHLRLVGISEGSTVLHCRPISEPVAPVGDVPVDSSWADHGMRSMVSLVEALEEGSDVQRWAKGMPGTWRLLKALDELGGSADFTWSSLDGSVVAATLSGRGRQYANGLRNQRRQDITSIVVTGRVVALLERGIVKIKTGTAPNAAAPDVRFDSQKLLELELTLGQEVSFNVTKTVETTMFGQVLETRYEYEPDSAVQLELAPDA